MDCLMARLDHRRAAAHTVQARRRHREARERCVKRITGRAPYQESRQTPSAIAGFGGTRLQGTQDKHGTPFVCCREGPSGLKEARDSPA